MRLTATRTTTFDAAHFLPAHPGKCARMHGHTYKVEVTVVRGDNQWYDPDTGMVLDFGDLARVLDETLKEFDHGILNDHIGLPTAEVLAATLVTRIAPELPKGILLDRVRVWETPESFVEVDCAPRQ